jgi:hypothetical protein
VTGEHVHHHVHENVQPVIHKETIVPHVVHTVVPIHESHHVAVQHHGTSTLPVKSVDEFLASGGSLKGHSKADSGYYEGCPRPYNKEMQTETLEADRNMHGHIAGQMNTSSHNGGLSGSRDIPGTANSGHTTSTSDTMNTASTHTTTGAHNSSQNAPAEVLDDKHGHHRNEQDKTLRQTLNPRGPTATTDVSTAKSPETHHGASA